MNEIIINCFHIHWSGYTGSIQDYVSAEVIVVNPSNIDSDLDVTCNADNDNVLKATIESQIMVIQFN